MKQKIVEIANRHNLTGMKRVMCYIIAPFVYGAGFVVGYMVGLMKVFKGELNSN